MSDEKSHYHVEINNIKVDGMTVKFNIFGDTFPQVTRDLETVIAYVSGSATASKSVATSVQPSNVTPAVVPVVNHPAAPKPVAPNGVKPAPAQAPAPAEIGVCVECGSSDLEWVSGNRKKDGKPFAAFRCQDCQKWQPEAK